MYETYSEVMGDYQPWRPVGIGKISREEVIEIDQSDISNLSR